MNLKTLILGSLYLGMSSVSLQAYCITNQKLHPFKLEDVNPNSATYNSSLGPQDYEKGLLLLNFAAPWCPPCREEFPLFEEQYKRGGINLLVVNIDDKESWNDMAGFENYTFPFLSTGKFSQKKGSNIANLYGIVSIPVTYVVKDKEIKEVKEGSFSKQELENIVKKYK